MTGRAFSIRKRAHFEKKGYGVTLICIESESLRWSHPADGQVIKLMLVPCSEELGLGEDNPENDPVPPPAPKTPLA